MEVDTFYFTYKRDGRKSNIVNIGALGHSYEKDGEYLI